jgi:hypothetical protein
MKLNLQYKIFVQIKINLKNITLIKKMEKEIVLEIINECLKVISERYNNEYQSFYAWISYSSDYEFMYIYEKIFKKYYPESYKLETGVVLSYYAVNLAHSIWSFYEVDNNTLKLSIFIRKFIESQFKNMDIYQLYLN